jgi:uncharacterized protein YndB with AHSA1/START domain
MTNTSTALHTTEHELRRRQLPAGEARCAVFRRTYDAQIDDVWDACTNPARLRRWYAPVEGTLAIGERFTQGDFGAGRIVACEEPRLLTIALGDGNAEPDQIELRLSEHPDGTTVLEFEHATTLDTHTIGGEIYDAVYCMGGGYGPRLISLEQHLRGELPEDVDPAQLHMREEYRPAIEQSMAALAGLLEADAGER